MSRSSVDHNAHCLQLPLHPWEVVLKRACKTASLYEELRSKFSKRHDRKRIIQRLDRFAQKFEDFEIKTAEGIWIARPVGKTETGFYLWNLIFRPSDQAVA